MMEKIPCICAMRDLAQALSRLEAELQDVYGVTLNEAMVMCSIGDDVVTAGSISDCCGMKAPHTSKVLAALEERGWVSRRFDGTDRRRVSVALTAAGRICLTRLKTKGLTIPPQLRLWLDGTGIPATDS